MDSPTNSTAELVIEVEQVNERESQNQETQSSESVVSGDLNVTNVSESFSIPPPEHHSSPNQARNNRRRVGNRPNHRHRRRRHHRHNRRSGDIRYEKTLLHFSAAHILLGIFCVLVQMVQFTNHSILSEAQPGLWCGTFFVITGSVCLGLAKTKGLYSTVAMLCFCLVSLFMALTLASLSWFGAEAASCCQEYSSYNCASTSGPPSFNITRTTATTPLLTSNSVLPTSTELAWIMTEAASNNTCYTNIENPPSCDDIKYGYCGYDIGLGRTLHLLLLFAGVIGATTSFVLSTLACSRPNREAERSRPRLSSIFAISGNDQLPTGGRPITAWEFPPPTKDVELATTPGIEDQYPDEPPPPYVEQDNVELQSYL